MKHLTISIALLLYGTIKLCAQTDTTIYRLELKRGDVLYGQAVSKEEGSFITLQKTDGSTQFLQWHEIKAYEATTFMANSEAVKKLQQDEEIKKKYSSWYAGLIITGKDTFERWIFPKPDYSTIGPGLDRAIRTANKLGQERKLEPEYYQQLIILGADTTNYITYSAPNAKLNIFKVINNGPCMLLQDRYQNKEEEPRVSPGSSSGGPGTGSIVTLNVNMQYVPTGNRYYLLYKGTWLKTKTKDGTVITDYFRDNCDGIFSECPELIAQLKSKTFASDDIREVVQAFNACLNWKK